MSAPVPSGAGQSLEGTVERVVYHDPRTRYTVLRLLVPGHDTLVTGVGRALAVEPGAEVTVTGHWDQHPTHGRQFSFGQLRAKTPTTAAGIERRLMRYPGVKQVMAARIVARFGLDALDILSKQPRRLLEVEGLGPRTLEKILEHHQSHTGPVAELEAQLLELDLPAHLAEPIVERYGDNSLSVLRSQPYRLAKDVRGIGFLTADRVAQAIGLAADSPERVEAGVLHVLERSEQDGHCGLPIEILVERASKSLGVDPQAVRHAGERLRRCGDLELDHGSDGTPLCYPLRLIDAERAVARILLELSTAKHRPWTVQALPEHLSEGQQAAVHAVARHGVVVLTGGPGTGKSTVVRQVLELATRHGADIHLAAPTGRAAKRLEQASGHSASTIHRLLEIQPETGSFTYGAGNPLPPGLLVVDESSMLDIVLARALFEALTPEHRVLLVGDADQLPSVGPGNVLRDIMRAAEHPEHAIALVRLTEVFRQAEGSSIVTNAHRILCGELPKADSPGPGGEFFVIAARDGEHAHDLVVRTAVERIPAAYGLDGRTDIQVLAPMHKGKAGTESLNRSLQAHHTAGAKELELKGAPGQAPRRFRVGDRVMQTRNDYQKNVFNGDVGTVCSVDPQQTQLVVDFDGVRIAYQGRELGALQLAYAVSIHKSQGSEFEAIVVALLPEHHVMLQRNLLYTAVTRARRLCVIVGTPDAVARAVQRTDTARRFTGLSRRLLEPESASRPSAGASSEDDAHRER